MNKEKLKKIFDEVHRENQTWLKINDNTIEVSRLRTEDILEALLEPDSPKDILEIKE